MLLKELLREASDIPDGIHVQMRQKGYKKLGAGVDQAAYIDANNNVIKIFGTTGTGKTLTRHQKMFIEWKKFCDAHQGTHLLPQHLDYETFEYKGKLYLQIKMERLFPINSLLSPHLSGFCYMAVAKNKSDFLAHIRNTVQSTDSMPITQRSIVAALTCIDDYEEFWHICNAINDLGKANGWHYDMHDENIMFDEDEKLVIVDPWHAGWAT